MKLSELLSVLDPLPRQADGTNVFLPDAEITAIVCDSRKAVPGALFVCVEGRTTDGHRFAARAYEAGTRFFLAQRMPELPADACVFLVADTRTALADLAAAFYGYPARNLTLIGITGTKGKTTTAIMLYRALCENGIDAAYIGTNGVYFADNREPTVNTTPESLELQHYLRRMADAGVRYLVMEVSSQALLLDRVHGLRFAVSLFTNLSRDHIGGVEHPDFENYRACKHLLFTDYGASTVIVNTDDPQAGYMLAGNSAETILTYGTGENADFRGTAFESVSLPDRMGVRFVCRSREGSCPVFLPFAGRFSMYNALAVIAVCRVCGINTANAARSLAHTCVPGRFELLRFPSLPGVTFIIDYAHNGTSLSAVLSSLRAYAPERLICLFGSVGCRTKERRREMGEVAARQADLCILTSDNPDTEPPEDIIAEIAAAFALPGSCPYLAIPDRVDAIRHAVRLARPGDMILLAGKGHEEYQLIDHRRVPFSERDILCDAVKKTTEKGGIPLGHIFP